MTVKFDPSNVELTINGQRIEGLKIEKMSVDLEKLVERIEFKNPPFPMRLEYRRRMTGAEITLSVRVPHRDTGEQTIVNHPIFVSYDDTIYMNEDYMFGLIFSRVKNAMIHEAREVFHVDGARLDDPHKGER